MIGPASNDDWWPRIVMLKALTQYQEFTGDPRVIPVMDKYFRYQLRELPKRPLRDWGKFRWQDELLSVIWLYNRTGSPYLLDLARLLHQQGYDWWRNTPIPSTRSASPRNTSSSNEGGGLKDLALCDAWREQRPGGEDRAGLVAGVRVSSGPRRGAHDDRRAGQVSRPAERHVLLRRAPRRPRSVAGVGALHRCRIYVFAGARAGNHRRSCLGDRLERLAFNALPGTFTDDMWAHQYNQEPNQVECSLHHKPWTTDGPESNLFGLEPNFGCCTANFHQGWPKFAASLFMLSGDQDSEDQDGLWPPSMRPAKCAPSLARNRTFT